MRILYIIFLLFLSSYANSLITFYSYNEARQSANKENRQLIVFAYSSSCGYCKKMEATTLKDKDIINLINKNFIFLKALVDGRENGKYIFTDKDIPSYLNPRYVPTLYVIDPKTQAEIRTLEGYKSPSQMISELFD